MPISVSCLNCGKQYNVTDEAAGKKFRCKECEAVVDVPLAAAQAGTGFGDDFSEPDKPFGDMDFDRPDAADDAMPKRRSSTQPPGDRAAELERLAGPAVGMMITAGIGLLGPLAWGAMMTIGAMLDDNIDPAELVPVFAVWGAILLTIMILQCLVIYGAAKMKKGESYGMAMTASIIASIPCLCICMPFGIWGIAVLSDHDVKAAFR